MRKHDVARYKLSETIQVKWGKCMYFYGAVNSSDFYSFRGYATHTNRLEI